MFPRSCTAIAGSPLPPPSHRYAGSPSSPTPLPLSLLLFLLFSPHLSLSISRQTLAFGSGLWFLSLRDGYSEKRAGPLPAQRREGGGRQFLCRPRRSEGMGGDPAGVRLGLSISACCGRPEVVLPRGGGGGTGEGNFGSRWV